MYFQMAASARAWIPAVGVVGWVWPYHSRPRSPWIPWLITQQPITFSLNLFIVFCHTEGARTDRSDGNVQLHVVLGYTAGLSKATEVMHGAMVSPNTKSSFCHSSPCPRSNVISIFSCVTQLHLSLKKAYKYCKANQIDAERSLQQGSVVSRSKFSIFMEWRVCACLETWKKFKTGFWRASIHPVSR